MIQDEIEKIQRTGVAHVLTPPWGVCQYLALHDQSLPPLVAAMPCVAVHNALPE